MSVVGGGYNVIVKDLILMVAGCSTHRSNVQVPSGLSKMLIYVTTHILYA